MYDDRSYDTCSCLIEDLMRRTVASNLNVYLII